jgi:hypothetical protein
VFFEHHDKHFGVDDRTGVEEFHGSKFSGNSPCRNPLAFLSL